MHKLVLVRHGESTWNKENRFTGWTDVDLTAKGREEAKAAGQALKKEGLTFDIAYTSKLKRAIETLDSILEQMGLKAIPVEQSWRLNERHYGALQGLNKAEIAAKHGEAQVKIWRRSFDAPPPPLDESDPRYEGKDPRYADIKVPRTECLKDTIDRVMPYWQGTIVPAIKAGKRVIIAAHGNSLRALIKYLDGISDSDIVEMNVPTGIPLLYELDDSLKPIRKRYLGDPEAVKQAMDAVAKQGKAK